MDCVAFQVPLSMGFPRQEYWSGLPFPSAGDHPDPGIEANVSCIGRWILYHQEIPKKSSQYQIFYSLSFTHTHTHLNFPFVKLMKHLICGK